MERINWDPKGLLMNESGWWNTGLIDFISQLGPATDRQGATTALQEVARRRTQAFREQCGYGDFPRYQISTVSGFKAVAFYCTDCDQVRIEMPRMNIRTFEEKPCLEYRCGAGHLVGRHVQK